MKIFLPFSTQGIGGTITFALKFQQGMKARGHEVFFTYRSDYDVLFAIVQAPFSYLREAKHRHAPIVQRLDGVFYWSVAKWYYPLLNLKARITRHNFANFTVYQSHYSKSSAERFLGKKPEEASAIIYNGVDLNLFSPDGERLDTLRDHPTQQLFFTASAFRRKDQIIPLLEAFQIYQKKYTPSCKLIVAGTFTPSLQALLAKYQGLKNVLFVGGVANKELPRYERAVDVFLFTHLNPPCPNNIIEALACGLPICGIDDGAMSELVEQGGNGYLLPTEGDAYWTERSYDYEAFADIMKQTIDRRDEFSIKSRERAVTHYSLENMISQYERILSSLTKNL